MLNESLKRVLEREVPWNELRQAGVLRRIHKDATRGSRARSRSRWPLVVVVACAVMVVAFVERGRWLRGPAPSTPALAVAPVSGDMLVRLPDGSTARGEGSAEVKVESLHADQADLVQTSGRVRYDVTPDPHRRFVVRVRDVQVRVLGTAFHVEVLPAAVAVRVERGSVQVVQLDRRVVLEAGEGITFDTTGSATSAPVKEPAQEATAPRSPGPEVISGQPRPNSSAPSGVSPAPLLERADRARARGDLDGAARALRELLQRHPDDTRTALAQFVLGRVRTAQGAHHEAAVAFAACLARAPSGSLAEDALAELARAHARAGERAEAVAAAQRYVSSYPTGVHQRAMRELVGEAH